MRYVARYIPSKRTLSTASHGYLSNSRSRITPQLQFFNSVTGDGSQIPTYRVIDGAGKVIEGATAPHVRSFRHVPFDC